MRARRSPTRKVQRDRKGGKDDAHLQVGRRDVRGATVIARAEGIRGVGVVALEYARKRGRWTARCDIVHHGSTVRVMAESIESEDAVKQVRAQIAALET